MGIPEMDSFWTGLCSKVSSGTANKDETILHRKLGKALSSIKVAFSTYSSLTTFLLFFIVYSIFKILQCISHALLSPTIKFTIYADHIFFRRT
jgi:hypothetical protein